MVADKRGEKKSSGRRTFLTIQRSTGFLQNAAGIVECVWKNVQSMQ
jgi:hypothetical protein